MKNITILKPILNKPSKHLKLKFPAVDLSGVKGVLIDFDDTLYNYAYPHWTAMHAVYKLFKPYAQDWKYTDFEQNFVTIWSALFEELGHVPSAHQRMTLFQRLAENLNAPKPFLIGMRAHRLYFKVAMREIRRQPKNKQMLSFLKECHDKKIPVCMVTDLFGLTQCEKLCATGLQKYIDFMVANDEVGADKPFPKIFERALEKLSLKPCDVIMIGDNVEKDLKGAENLGIKSYRVYAER